MLNQLLGSIDRRQVDYRFLSSVEYPYGRCLEINKLSLSVVGHEFDLLFSANRQVIETTSNGIRSFILYLDLYHRIPEENAGNIMLITWVE